MSPQAALTVKETACLAEVTPRTVEKAIENRVLFVTQRKPRRPGGAQRFLPPLAVVYLAALRASDLTDLPLQKKKLFWRGLKELATSKSGLDAQLKPVSIGRGVVVKVDEIAANEFASAVNYIDGKRKYVVEDPDILGGTPVISGTRMNVYSVLARINEGETLREIHEDNPDISLEALQTAEIYARANPVLGRPKAQPWHVAA